VRRRALEHRDTLCMGRSHGVHAEPTSFGHKLAVFAFQLDRDRDRLRRAREAVNVGAISGVVGSYATLDPRIEELVCGRLGLRPAEASTQVLQRDRHAEYLAVLAVSASTLDALATEIRHLARTEVREVQEPFAEGQKGSSAMPHKRNPVVCERVSGLSRVIRGQAVAGFENVALWHERDISHSSAERLLFPDATGLLSFMLRDLTWVLDGLLVFPDRMREHVFAHGGLAFSQTLLLALIEEGMDRDKAYRLVQAAASAAWDQGSSFRRTVQDDPEVTARLDPAALDAVFDPARFLRNLGGVFDRLEKLPVEET
jgi:adenylosuccinate lyase